MPEKNISALPMTMNSISILVIMKLRVARLQWKSVKWMKKKKKKYYFQIESTDRQALKEIFAENCEMPFVLLYLILHVVVCWIFFVKKRVRKKEERTEYNQQTYNFFHSFIFASLSQISSHRTSFYFARKKLKVKWHKRRMKRNNNDDF